MQAVQLKLKQASAVLETTPKELQNFVQCEVLNPRRRAGLYVFDAGALFAAEVVLLLKRGPGMNTQLLSEFAGAFVSRLPAFREEKLDVIVSKSCPSPGWIAVEVKVPFRELAQQVKEQLRWVELYKDLPRGRKRPAWKKEFLATLCEAGQDMGDVSPEKVLKTIRQYRNEKKREPEVTLEAEPQAARA